MAQRWGALVIQKDCRHKPALNNELVKVNYPALYNDGVQPAALIAAG